MKPEDLKELLETVEKKAVERFAERLKKVRYENTWRFAKGETDVDPYGVSDEQIDETLKEFVRK